MAMPAHIREVAEAQIPVGRVGLEDIGRAVAFLTADNDYITGINLPVNGVFTCHFVKSSVR